MQVISAGRTQRRPLMSPEHLIAVGAEPACGRAVTLSPPFIYSDVCPFRLELRRHREEELQAPGEVLRSQLLLEQEDQEVRQVN